jgi:hypothetical protein
MYHKRPPRKPLHGLRHLQRQTSRPSQTQRMTILSWNINLHPGGAHGQMGIHGAQAKRIQIRQLRLHAADRPRERPASFAKADTIYGARSRTAKSGNVSRPSLLLALPLRHCYLFTVNVCGAGREKELGCMALAGSLSGIVVLTPGRYFVSSGVDQVFGDTNTRRWRMCVSYTLSFIATVQTWQGQTRFYQNSARHRFKITKIC